MTSAKEFGKLAYFRGKNRNPAKDRTFCKTHLEGKEVEEQAFALLEWLDGYDEEKTNVETNF